MRKVKCFCGRNTLNEQTAFASVGNHVCCCNMCYQDALQAHQAREIEPQGVTGAQNGYNFTKGGWDVT